LRMNISHACIAVALDDEMRDRMHEVRLAETDAAVEEQRVVCVPRILRDLKRRGLRELIALAFDEAAEREVGIDPRADDEPFRPPRPARWQLRRNVRAGAVRTVAIAA